MTTPRPGDAYHLDLDGTVVNGPLRRLELMHPCEVSMAPDAAAHDTAAALLAITGKLSKFRGAAEATS